MSRFGSVSREDLNNLVGDKDAPTTKKATEQSWRVFEAYCKENGIEFNMETVIVLFCLF